MRDPILRENARMNRYGLALGEAGFDGGAHGRDIGAANESAGEKELWPGE